MSSRTNLSRSARFVPAALAVVLAALVATSAWLWWDKRPDVDHSVTAAAGQQAVNFFSLDHRHIEADLDRVLALATGEFKQQYAQQRDRIAEGVRHRKVTVTAAVPDNGVALEYQRGDDAQVLVAIDATTKQAKAKKSKTNRYRVRLTMRRVDSEWLVSEINQAG